MPWWIGVVTRKSSPMTIRPRCSAWRTPTAEPVAADQSLLRAARRCAKFSSRAKMGTIMVKQVLELRRTAALCRRAAAIPTSGAQSVDRILVALAEQLERDALSREQQVLAAGSSRHLKIEPIEP